MSENFWRGFTEMVFELRLMLQTIQVMLIILKLCDIMTYSWWLIATPMWINFFMILILYIVYYVSMLKEKAESDEREKEIENWQDYVRNQD